MDVRRAVLAASLACLGPHARGADAASLALLARGPGMPDWVDRLRAILAADLRESGAVRLVDAGGGAEYLLRLLARPLTHGKLALACEVSRPRGPEPLFRKVFIGEPRALPRLAHRVADRVVGAVTGNPGAADSRVLASLPTALGVREICSMDPFGGNLRRITTFGGLSSDPAVAPDGRLAFVTYRGGPPQIWGQVLPQAPLQRIYPAPGASGQPLADLAWSPDGCRLAFVQGAADGASQVKVLDLRARKVAVLTPSGLPAQDPTWNPDGSELLFLAGPEASRQVYRVAAGGGPARPVTQDPAPKTCAAWGPHGDLIAYVARSGAGSRVLVAAAAGGPPRQLGLWPEPVTSICWAPDQRRLLLSIRQGRHARLRVVGLDGSVRDLPEAIQGSDPQWVRNPAALAHLASATPGTAGPG